MFPRAAFCVYPIIPVTCPQSDLTRWCIYVAIDVILAGEHATERSVEQNVTESDTETLVPTLPWSQVFSDPDAYGTIINRLNSVKVISTYCTYEHDDKDCKIVDCPCYIIDTRESSRDPFTIKNVCVTRELNKRRASSRRPIDVELHAER